MLSCDVIVAAEQTKFVFAYPSIGLTPGLRLLPVAARRGTAAGPEFCSEQQAISADVARQWGLVTEVAPDAGARARELAATFAGGPAVVLGQARRLLRAGWELDRSATGLEEARTIGASVAGREAQDLIAKFTAR